jgi:hypothetical protein
MSNDRRGGRWSAYDATNMRQLYEAHPAFGLRPQPGRDLPHAYPMTALGFAWLSLSGADQRARETAFFRALVTATTRPDDNFEALMSSQSAAETVAAAAACVPTGTTVTGQLTLPVIEAILTTEPDALFVDDAEGQRIVLTAPWRGVGVWLDPAEVDRISGELDAAMAIYPEFVVRRTKALRMHAVYLLLVAVCLGVSFGIMRLIDSDAPSYSWPTAVGLLVGLAVFVPLIRVEDRFARRWYGPPRDCPSCK